MRHSIAVLCSSTVFFFLMCAAAPVNAQSDETQTAGTQTAPKNSLVKGAWALQFKVDSDAILSEFGGSVAIKRHVSDRSAFRVGFDYGLSTQDFDAQYTDGESDRQTDRDQETVGMFVDFLRYTDVESPVHFFWGTGPFGSYGRSKSSEQFVVGEQESVAKTWSAGISGRVGVEWFVARSLSFHAEYFGTAYYLRVTSTHTTRTGGEAPNTYESTTDQWALSRGPVVFGLSAYF